MTLTNAPALNTSNDILVAQGCAAGELVAIAEHEHEIERVQRGLVGAGIQLRRQEARPQHQPIDLPLAAHRPAARGRHTLREPENRQRHALAVHRPAGRVVHRVEVADVVLDLAHAVLARHPRSSNLADRAGPVHVEARQTLRRHDQAPPVVQRVEPRQEAAGELPIAVAHDPDLGGRLSVLAEHVVARRAWDRQVVFLEHCDNMMRER